MSNITAWVYEVLYPAIYPHMDRVLPEFDLELKADNWISRSNLKVTGERGDSVGKVQMWNQAPGFIKDFTREGDSKCIINYIMAREGKSFYAVISELASIAGVDLPANSGSSASYKYDPLRDRAALYEEVSYYLRYNLALSESDEAEEARSYLKKRGYTMSEIQAMHLGFLPSQENLRRHLMEKGYLTEFIDENIDFVPSIGKTHKLAITWRSSGKILGFKFRTTGHHEPKYYNSTGLSKKQVLFNLDSRPGPKDLVVVEGELDALHATVKGLKNVVATGGSTISPEQVEDAVKHGARSFTLLFDTNETKKNE